MKPVVLIAFGPCFENQFYSHAMMLLESYERAITRNGGIPLMPLDETCIEEYVKIADALVIPGAQYEMPKQGIPHALRIEASNYRESLQTPLIEAFAKAKKPIMGICEGCQKINCVFGGSLKLDLGKDFGVSHCYTAHSIEIKEDSFLGKLWGKTAFVNSFHNFYVDELGKGLIKTSVSPEGNLESFEHESLPIYGLQFHPERMGGDECFPPDGADGDLVFKTFIKQAMKGDY